MDEVYQGLRSTSVGSHSRIRRLQWMFPHTFSRVNSCHRQIMKVLGGHERLSVRQEESPGFKKTKVSTSVQSKHPLESAVMKDPVLSQYL